MISFGIFEKILPPQDKFFYSCFEESASICKEAAYLFSAVMNNGLTQEAVIEARRLKEKSSITAKGVLAKLNTSFITPIDREDIQLMASLLNKITRRIVKACKNLQVYRLEENTPIMKEQADVLLKAANELIESVSYLKKTSMVKEVTECNHRMKIIENLGDEVFYKAKDDLFSGKYDALTVIKLRDIYKDIEFALDTCYFVSDQVVNIVLKHG
jgi:uncharacterized protein Yka (UPF0111/DUF47 family)